METEIIINRKTKAEIEKLPVNDGNIYFSTDSNEIFMDNGKSRKSYGKTPNELREQIQQNKDDILFINELKENFIFNEINFEHGGFTSTGIKDTFYQESRIRNKKVMLFPYDIVIEHNKNIHGSFYTLLYDDENKRNPKIITWNKDNSLKILKNTYFDLILSLNPYKNNAETINNILKGFYYKKSTELLNFYNNTIENKIPNYYFENNYLKEKVNDIYEKSSYTKGVSFCFITDTHIKNNAKQSIKLIKYLQDKTNAIPFIIFGGDVNVTSVETKEDIYKEVIEWQEYISILDKNKIYPVRGNHDFNGYYMNDIGEKTWFYQPQGYCFRNIIGNIEKEINSDTGEMYYYFDNKLQNTRFIILDCINRFESEGKYSTGISQKQYDWILNSALNCENMNIIFISHHSSDSTMKFYEFYFKPLQDLLIAFKNKTILDVDSYGIRLYKDFSQDKNNFVFHLCGHSHVDENHIDNGVLTVTTNCDALYNDVSGLDRTVGTINEQSFDIVNINTENRIINMTRIGAGSNREFTY